MRKFLVQDNQIVGDYTGILVNGYEVFEGNISTFVDISELFVDGTEIKQKPPKQNESDFWNSSTNRWVQAPVSPASLNLSTPNYAAINFALSPGGSHESLLLKALSSQAPPLLQGSLPSAIAFGNLPAIKASLEAIVDGMPEGSRFTTEEIESLDKLFNQNSIPAKIHVSAHTDGLVNAISVALA